MVKHFRSLMILPLLAVWTSAQVASGGDFALEKIVIAGGGGTVQSSELSLSSTSGQAIAGPSHSVESPFSLSTGFWSHRSLAPTAATVAISGRITGTSGVGIRGARLTLMGGPYSIPQTSISNGFGHYRFDHVPSGYFYVLTISHKTHHFSDATRAFDLNDAIFDLDFRSIN